MKESFNSLEELRAEIYTLKISREQQEQVIAAKFEGPGATFTTVLSLFKSKKQGAPKSLLDGFLSQDLVTSITKIVLPFLVNSVIFRRSGFITRGIATFLSQKAAKNVNTGVLSELVGKVKGFFDAKKKAGKPAATVKDYGIPPDSETY